MTVATYQCDNCGLHRSIDESELGFVNRAAIAGEKVEIAVCCPDCGAWVASWRVDRDEVIPDGSQLSKELNDVLEDIQNVMTDDRLRDIENRIRNIQRRI